ncbi:MAG TPA: hypothetical protein VLZ74_10770 [Methylocella sp.]|nr:hypothetical protein [Methylocella sp.]
MFGIGRLAAGLILGIVVLGARAEAQDTSFMDMNMNMGCMLMAGMHEMQVSVYQAGALDDACPGIPSPGPTVITLTSPSKELRDLTAEVRLVRGENTDATAGAKLEPITLAHLPPKTYPTGVITLPANLDKPGKYTVLVTVSDGKDMTMSGQLVMNVGEEARQWVFVFAFAGVVLAAAFGYYFWDLNRKKKLPVQGS